MNHKFRIKNAILIYFLVFTLVTINADETIEKINLYKGYLSNMAMLETNFEDYVSVFLEYYKPATRGIPNYNIKTDPNFKGNFDYFQINDVVSLLSIPYARKPSIWISNIEGDFDIGVIIIYIIEYPEMGIEYDLFSPKLYTKTDLMNFVVLLKLMANPDFDFFQ